MSNIPRKKDGTFCKGFLSPLRNGIYRICETCGNNFYLQGYRIKDKKRGRFCNKNCKYISAKGKRVSINSEFKIGQNKGNKHFLWKGDKVGYYALHKWIYNNWGTPFECERCGKTQIKIEWSNKNGRYNRIKSNWETLCISCHRKEDKENPKKPKYE